MVQRTKRSINHETQLIEFSDHEIDKILDTLEEFNVNGLSGVSVVDFFSSDKKVCFLRFANSG